MEIPTIDEEIYTASEALKFKNVAAKKISIVIPFFNNWELTHSRLMELWKHVYTYEVILVNDASTEPNIDAAVAWWQKETELPVKYIVNKENKGFGTSMNIGVWAATGDIVVLLSNDVVITGDFSLEVLAKLEPKTLVGNILYDFPTGWNVFSMPDGDRLFPYLGGDFLACYRDDFLELGGFDDRYNKFDYEDVDLSTRAVYLTYQLIPLNSPYLKHLSGQTVRKHYPDREKYTNVNREVFYRKWKQVLYENPGDFPDNSG